jgi:hypothetical protein
MHSDLTLRRTFLLPGLVGVGLARMVPANMLSQSLDVTLWHSSTHGIMGVSMGWGQKVL